MSTIRNVLETFVSRCTLHAPIDMSSAVFYLFVLKVVLNDTLRASQAFSVSRRWNISREAGPTAASKKVHRAARRAPRAAGLFKETIIKVALIKRVVA